MRLLLVEDDRTLRSNLKTDLERAGFAVDGVDNGVDGQYLGENEPYDVAVLDLGLPDRPGLGLAIVADIVEQYGGRLDLGRSRQLGGFQARVELSA